MKKLLFIMILLFQGLLFANQYCKAYKAYEMDDFVLAKQELDPLAFKGDAQAQNLLGLLNLEQEKNAAGQKWLQNSAVKGNAKAAYNLGVYFYALGQNSKAEQWMHKAESLTQAKTALGFLYIGKDVTKAKAYFAQAAQEGNHFAKSHLCALLATNQTATDNEYVNLCQGDVSEDLYITGKYYTSPKRYGSLDKAIYYLGLAADNGNVKAMNLLGESLYKRRGSSDEAKALSYFVKASALGSIDAKVNAAWIYYVGQKWTRKPQKGFVELTEAYGRGNAKAQLYMGILKIRGFTFSYETVRQDVAGGIADIQKSAAQNDPEALMYLIKNYPNLPQTQEYQKQLRRYYRDEAKSRALNFLYDEC